MNVWTDSERKWARESESKTEIKENHLHHKDMSYQANTTQILINANNLFSCSQSVQCILN